MHRLTAFALTLAAMVMALTPALASSGAYAAPIPAAPAPPPHTLMAGDCHTGAAASSTPTPAKHHGKATGDCLSQCLAQCLAIHSGILPHGVGDGANYPPPPPRHPLAASMGQRAALSGIDPPPPRRG